MNNAINLLSPSRRGRLEAAFRRSQNRLPAVTTSTSTDHFTPVAKAAIAVAAAQGNKRMLDRLTSAQASLPSIEELETELGRDFVEQIGNSNGATMPNKIRALIALAVLRFLYPRDILRGQAVVVMPLGASEELSPNTPVRHPARRLLAPLLIDPVHPMPRNEFCAQWLGGGLSVRIPMRSPLSQKPQGSQP
jgi:hypothetical protein